jgi:hypothetical protein
MWASLKSSHFLNGGRWPLWPPLMAAFFHRRLLFQQQPLFPLRQCGQLKSGHIASKVVTFDGRF